MQLTFTEKEEQFRQEFRTWLHKNLPEGWLEGKRDLPENLEERIEFLRDWQRKLYEGGWAGIHWPKEYGGRGSTVIEDLIYQEELARVEAPLVINYMGINMIGPTLILLGTEEQKKKYINKILSGEEIWCQGFSEPNAGSDLAKLQTRAIKKNGKWYITGQKVWTTYAHVADRCLLLARTNDGSNKHDGITAFLIDMHQPGVEVRPIYQMNDSHEFNEVFLNEVEALDEDIVLGVGRGWEVSMALLAFERLGIGGMILNLDNYMNDLINDLTNIKMGKESLIHHHETRLKLSKLFVKKEAAKLNYYRNISKISVTGKPSVETSIDKILGTGLMWEITEMAVTSLGLLGLEKSNDKFSKKWAYQYLGGFAAKIAGGTPEINKNVIGERVLGLPKDFKH